MRKARQIVYWLSFIGIFVVGVIAFAFYARNIDQTPVRFFVENWYFVPLTLVLGWIAAVNKDYA